MTVVITLFSGSWLNQLLNMSLTGSIVIAVILLARLALKKAPRVYSYILWAAAAFRLVCPVSFSSGISLLNLAAAPAAAGSPAAYAPTDTVHFANAVLPAITEAVAAPMAQGTAFSLTTLITGIWLAGVLTLLLWALCSSLSLRRKMRTAVRLEGNVFQSEYIRSPFILGLIRPRIYIPYGLDNSQLRCVLAHERCHLRRGDHIVKVFSFALLAFYWFDPLCWLAFHLMSRDMEVSCDERVLARAQCSAAEYSTVLLSFAASRRFPTPCPLAFGETGAKSRIKHALRWKRPKVWVTVIAAAACIAVIAACAADPVEQNTGDADAPSAADTVPTDSATEHPIDSDWLSAHTAFQFWVHFDCTHVTATCTTGQLLDPHSVSYGRELTYAAGQPICWAHLTDDLFYETDDCTPMISYTVYSGDAALHTGHLLLSRNGDAVSPSSAQYTAVTVDENGQPLARGSGGSSDITTYVNYDLTDSGPVALSPAQLPTYLFKTNSTKIAIQLEPTNQSAEILLYAADGAEPILSFTHEAGDKGRCTFTNLTSSRYYYLTATCGADVTLTISDS